MKNNSIKTFLASFFALFQAYIKEFRVEDNKVLGVIGWQDEEDEQCFSWLMNFKESVLLKIKLLCEFLIKNDLIQSDKIIISPSELKILLHSDGWNTNETEIIINKLCSVKIKMIDDGEETDSFFIHF